MRVTRIMCDRCQDQVAEHTVLEKGMELILRYEGGRGDLPLAERASDRFRECQRIDLCPDCRAEFGSWLREGPVSDPLAQAKDAVSG